MVTGEALVRSVNVGRPRAAAWAGIGRTAIDKQRATGRVRVDRFGLWSSVLTPDGSLYTLEREYRL